ALFLRNKNEVVNNAVAPRFNAPCSKPIFRAGGSTSDQSVKPVAAAPIAARSPMAKDVSAAKANSRLPPIESRASKHSATVHAPIGTSVSTTCKGSPNHVPLKKFLIFCA